MYNQAINAINAENEPMHYRVTIEARNDSRNGKDYLHSMPPLINLSEISENLSGFNSSTRKM